MLTISVIVAALAAGALIRWPRSGVAAACVALLGAGELATGAVAVASLGLLVSLVVFLTAALTLAGVVERSGLTERVAVALAAAARGDALVLYVLVCGLCALVTAVVSLDGAVVLMVPVLLVLGRRFGAPLPALLLGVVAVANAASIAVPQGNPTNLVVIDRLGLAPAAFVTHMLVPGLVAAAGCATVVAVLERHALGRPLQTGERPRTPLSACDPASGDCSGTPLSAPDAAPADRARTPLSAPERRAGVALLAAGLAAWTAPLLGVAPWWPFAGAVVLALALGRERPRVVVPWRIAAQVGGLLVVTEALHLPVPTGAGGGLLPLLAVSAGVGLAAALANNLPVSVSAAGLLAAGPTAYAASIGLAVGSLGLRQGSVATLVAADLAGSHAPPIPARRLALLAMVGVPAATVVLWGMQ